MNIQLSNEEKSHLSHTVEVLQSLIPTLSKFNEELFRNASKLFTRPATQSLMGMAMHGKQCENELYNVAVQYNANLEGLSHSTRFSEQNTEITEGGNALQFALNQEEKIKSLYENALEDDKLDGNLSSLLRNQLLHLNHQFTQLKQLHSCQPQLGLLN